MNRSVLLIIFVLAAAGCEEPLSKGPSELDASSVDGGADGSENDSSDAGEGDSSDAEEIDIYVDPCLNKKCDHPNPCIDGECESETGDCVYGPVSVTCTDNNVCTENDYCSNSICKPGTKKDCSDGNVCTEDSCDSQAECLFKNNVLLCSDNSVCTKVDECVGGTCQTSGSLNCDDSNSCTFDLCKADQGCVHTNDSLPCTDDNVCTLKDKCLDGKCNSGVLKNCDDGNFCTTEICDKKFGCVTKKNILLCDDGNFCTEGEFCKEGVCVNGKVVLCDDGNFCTADSCSQQKNKCNNTPKQYAVCDDADECTYDDYCLNKKCIPGKSIGCCKTDGDCKGSSFGIHCSYLHALNVASPKEFGLCNACKETLAGSTCAVGDCLLGVEKINNHDRAMLYCSGMSFKDCKNDGKLCTIKQPNYGAGGKEICGSLDKECDDKNKCTLDVCDTKTGWCKHEAVTGCT
jgi:hypothetical protein